MNMATEKTVRPVIGFIGLGVMGRPMAENLLAAGYPLMIHNRSQAVVRALAEMGATPASTSADLARASDIVITMLPDTPDVETVYFGSHGVFAGARAGHLLVDMSTVSPALARRIAQRGAEVGASCLDAPVSGGDLGARAGSLSIMAGGNRADFERALPVFRVLGGQIKWMGQAGAGQVTKACNQIIVALTIEAIGEAFALARRSGIELADLREVLLGGFAQSRVLDVHGQRLLDNRFDPGFRVALHRKDLTIALAEADAQSTALPVSALIHAMFNALVAQGHGGRDHSYLAAYIDGQSRPEADQA